MEMYRPFKPFPAEFYPRMKTRYEVGEGLDDYLSRMQVYLPEVPPEVIRLLLYDHHHGIDRYRWLPFNELDYRLEHWSTDQLLDSELLADPVVQYFADSSIHNRLGTERVERLLDAILREGTWPSPPVLLRISGCQLLRVPWIDWSLPLHLIDGYRRFSLLLSRAEAFDWNRTHRVWVLTSRNR